MCRGRWLCCRLTPTLEEEDNKAVLAGFLQEVSLRRRDDFMAALGQAASQRFNNLVELALARLLRSIVPGFDASFIELLIAYPDMVANDQSAHFETNRAAWRTLSSEQPDAPQRLLSIELSCGISLGAYLWPGAQADHAQQLLTSLSAARFPQPRALP